MPVASTPIRATSAPRDVTSPPIRATPAPPRTSPAVRATSVAIAATTVLAFALREYQLQKTGLWAVTQYDDGPYFGAAVRLVHGVLPYRDFAFVQPPGISLLMGPAALASYPMGTAWGLVFGRILTVLAGTAAVLLAGLLVRHRGPVAVLLTCGILAIYPPGAQAAHTVLLEPWLVLFCLAGAVAVFDGDRIAASTGRLAWGGAAFGFAGAIKAWAIVPVLVIAVLCLPGLRRGAVFVAGVAAGFAIPVLPFVLAAPRPFYDDVFVAQLARIGASTPVWHRLQSMLGIPPGTPVWSHAAVLAACAALVAFVAITQVVAWRITRRPPPPLDGFATLTAALVVAMFLWPPYFAGHYSAFLAPFLALALALPVSRLAGSGTAPAAGAQRPGPARSPWPARAGLAALGLAVVAGTVLQAAPRHGVTHPTAADRVIPRGACVATDQAAFLLLANRFLSTVPGCTQMVDGLGTDLALSGGHRPGYGAGEVPAVAAAWRQAFSHAGYVLLSRGDALRIAWTPQLLAYFGGNFRPVLYMPGFTVYARNRA